LGQEAIIVLSAVDPGKEGEIVLSVQQVHYRKGFYRILQIVAGQMNIKLVFLAHQGGSQLQELRTGDLDPPGIFVS